MLTEQKQKVCQTIWHTDLAKNLSKILEFSNISIYNTVFIITYAFLVICHLQFAYTTYVKYPHLYVMWNYLKSFTVVD